jgi:hypothetical protein
VSLTAATGLGGGLVSSLVLPSVASAATDVITIPAGVQGVASVVDSNGNTQVAVIGSDGTVYHDISGQASFEQVLEGGQPVTATRVAMAAIPATAGATAGSMQLVTVGTDGNVYHTIRNADGSWQSNLGELPAPAAGPVSDVGISANSHGSTIVAALDDGAPYVDERLVSGSWTGWQQIPAPVQESRLAIATTPSDTTTIVISGNDGTNTGTYAVTGTMGAWGAWQQINSTVADNGVSAAYLTPASGSSQSGITVAEMDDAGDVYTNSQQTDGTWAAQLLQATGDDTSIGVSLSPDGLITSSGLITPTALAAAPTAASGDAPTNSTTGAASADAVGSSGEAILNSVVGSAQACHPGCPNDYECYEVSNGVTETAFCGVFGDVVVG